MADPAVEIDGVPAGQFERGIDFRQHGRFARNHGGEATMLSEIYAPLELSSGDSVYFDGRIGHAFLSRTSTPARLLLVITGDGSV